MAGSVQRWNRNIATSIATYSLCAAIILLHQAELAATSAYVDGPSDGRRTSQGTAASVAVLEQHAEP